MRTNAHKLLTCSGSRPSQPAAWPATFQLWEPQRSFPAACWAVGDVCRCPAQEADLLHMERTVLNSLGFRVNAPTAYTFWSIFRMSHAAADETSSLALYLTVRPAGV